MNADRPLTDAQERALIRLADLSESRPSRDRARAATGMPTAWFRTSRFCRSTSTASVLERLGLLELRFAPFTNIGIARLGGSDYEARITDAGRALLDSMGD